MTSSKPLITNDQIKALDLMVPSRYLFHIDNILMCQPPMRALMIPKVMDPITLRMINAGMVATAHLTMRTTIDPKGILISVTTTLLESAAMLTFSYNQCP